MTESKELQIYKLDIWTSLNTFSPVEPGSPSIPDGPGGPGFPGSPESPLKKTEQSKQNIVCKKTLNTKCRLT